MKLSKQFIEEIKSFETIYCLVSGGYHSTTSGLLLKDHGFENVILLHNKTYLETKSSIEAMKKLQEITNYEYIETKPNLKGESVLEILKRSFQKIPDVKIDIEKGHYDRTKFECCKKLKKGPRKKFYNQFDKEKIVIISSICPFEGGDRARWLYDLRKKNTFIRLHKKQGNVFHAYPFRDSFSKSIFLPYLKAKGFDNIKHSACKFCPIVIVFCNYKAINYYDSSQFALKWHLPCFQKTLKEFMEV